MTKWCFRMEKASKDWLRNKILWLSDQNSRKKSHVTEYPYIGHHFRKWFDSYKILQILVFATQKVLLKWGNLQILYCDISKTKSCQILVPRKKIGKKKYVKFFAQGSCVQTKSGVAEIKRNFTNFAGWFQKKSASYHFHSTYGKKAL